MLLLCPTTILSQQHYQNAIEIRNVTKKYDGFTLDSISFDVPRGSIMGFIGQNGAGKTTTIRSLLNIIPINAGQINPKEYMDALQVEQSEFDLIKYPERGVCLFKCGNERYLLQVIAPEYKAALFGKAGGR